MIMFLHFVLDIRVDVIETQSRMQELSSDTQLITVYLVMTYEAHNFFP